MIYLIMLLLNNVIKEIVMESNKDIIRTSAAIPKDLHEQLRWVAFKQRISIAELIRRALKEYFENHKLELEKD